MLRNSIKIGFLQKQVLRNTQDMSIIFCNTENEKKKKKILFFFSFRFPATERGIG